jgi:hypothetical protein
MVAWESPSRRAERDLAPRAPSAVIGWGPMAARPRAGPQRAGLCREIPLAPPGVTFPPASSPETPRGPVSSVGPILLPLGADATLLVPSKRVRVERNASVA